MRRAIYRGVTSAISKRRSGDLSICYQSFFKPSLAIQTSFALYFKHSVTRHLLTSDLSKTAWSSRIIPGSSHVICKLPVTVAFVRAQRPVFRGSAVDRSPWRSVTSRQQARLLALRSPLIRQASCSPIWTRIQTLVAARQARRLKHPSTRLTCQTIYRPRLL